MTIEVEREMEGILYYVSVRVALSGEDIDAHVAEDVPELSTTRYERTTGQAIHEPTGALAFQTGDEIDLDDRETTRALFAMHEAAVEKSRAAFSIGDSRYSIGHHARPLTEVESHGSRLAS